MFWMRFMRLLLSVAREGIDNAFGLFVFLFRRQRERQRVLALLCEPARRRPTRGVQLVLVLTLGGLLLGGCAPFPGASFEKQVAEFQWSAETLVAMPEWRDSLVEDLEMLADPEWDQLPESINMLGW